MNNKLPLRDRALRSLIFGRFEPVETILGLSAIAHGLWLVFPDWGTSEGPVGGSISSAGRMFELSTGILLAIVGAACVALMAFGVRRPVRKYFAMAHFMLWSFIAWISFMATVPTSIVWVAYLTIALVSAAVYLNLGLRNGDH